MNNKERRDSQIYKLTSIHSTYPVLFYLTRSVDQMKEFQMNEEDRNRNRSPLATNNYFSKFDRIVEQRLAQAAETFEESSVVADRKINKCKYFNYHLFS